MYALHERIAAQTCTVPRRDDVAIAGLSMLNRHPSNRFSPDPSRLAETTADTRATTNLGPKEIEISHLFRQQGKKGAIISGKSVNARPPGSGTGGTGRLRRDADIFHHLSGVC